MMHGSHNKADAPIIRDIRAYAQKGYTVLDECAVAVFRNTSFLSSSEEEWYQKMLLRYRQEFGLKPQP